MKTIEKVRMIKTVRAGDLMWEAGKVLPELPGESLHPIILDEIKANTGTVEVLSYGENVEAEKSNLSIPLSGKEVSNKDSKLDAHLIEHKINRDAEIQERQSLIKEIEDLKLAVSGLESKASSVIGVLRKDLEFTESHLKELTARIDGKESVANEQSKEGTETSPKAKKPSVGRTVIKRRG